MNALSMAELQQGAIAVGVSIAIGLLCRVLNLPIPAPPTVVGVLMIAGLAVGYGLGGFWR